MPFDAARGSSKNHIGRSPSRVAVALAELRGVSGVRTLRATSCAAPPAAPHAVTWARRCSIRAGAEITLASCRFRPIKFPRSRATGSRQQHPPLTGRRIRIASRRSQTGPGVDDLCAGGLAFIRTGSGPRSLVEHDLFGSRSVPRLGRRSDGRLQRQPSVGELTPIFRNDRLDDLFGVKVATRFDLIGKRAA
jgi:hypothetical protein